MTETGQLHQWATDHRGEAILYRDLMDAWRDDLKGGLEQIRHASLRLNTARRLFQSGEPLDAALRKAHETHHGK
jgi:hypothetical protein